MASGRSADPNLPLTTTLTPPRPTGPRDMIGAIERCDGGAGGAEGLTATLQRSELAAAGGAQAAAARELRYWWGLFSSSLFFTVPVFVVAMVLPMIPGERREAEKGRGKEREEGRGCRFQPKKNRTQCNRARRRGEGRRLGHPI